MAAPRVSMMRACFFNVPTWARVAGCPVRNEVLGTDYTAIVERAETVLLPAFDAWRSGEADAKGPGAVHGTLDWVFAEYRADRRFTKLDPNTRRRNHEVGLDTPGLGATACATMRSRGSRRRVNRRRLRERGCRSPRSCERAIWMSRCVHSCARAYIGHPLDTALGIFCLTLCNSTAHTRSGHWHPAARIEIPQCSRLRRGGSVLSFWDERGWQRTRSRPTSEGGSLDMRRPDFISWRGLHTLSNPIAQIRSRQRTRRKATAVKSAIH